MKVFSLVFLLDVDNTLLNNDQLKDDLAQQGRALLGEERAERFWQIYEEVRHDEDYVDFPATLARFAAEFPDAPNDRLRSLVMDVPFASYLYPGALAAITYLNSIGQAVILSDGDHIFQMLKIERSGLAAAVAGRVVITVHKERELATVFTAYPAEHYVLIDDKPTILATVERCYGERFTTVLVCQGKYARLGNVSPPPDIVVPHIADLVHIPPAEFLDPSAPQDQPPPAPIGAQPEA
jgi:FMN phosphatase YigB (HAD superfamily)